MSWVKRLFGKREREEELEEEVRNHLKMAAQDRVERGATAVNAERAARRDFGNVELVKEVTRDAWGWGSLERLVQDLRFGLRMMAKSLGFTAVAVLTLALGIGANTALFSIVNGVLLNPLPYPHPEQLVELRESKPNFATGSISYPNFLDWQKDNRTFASMAIVRGNRSYILTGLGEAEQVDAVLVSTGFFEQLSVNPVLGRTFAPGEDRIGAAPTVMITEGFWKRKFGSAQDVLGKILALDGKGYTIIGVIPATFDLLGSLRTREVYMPIGQWNNPLLNNRAAGLGIGAIGRLKPDVTVQQARADMERVTQNLAAAYPQADKGIGAAVIPLRKWLLGSVEPFLLVLFGAVGLVLLIACANVANLLLARSTGRAHEFAIRAALGAGQGRIVRQLLTESTLLAAIGGGLGVLLAAAGTRAALGVLPSTLPRAAEVAVDGRVLLFAGAISLLAGICFGLVPALKTRKPDVQETLKKGGRGESGTRYRAQGALVTVEMALALVLLIGAGLMIRTLAALWNVNPGFEANKVLSFGFSLPPSMTNASPEAIRAAFRQVHDKFQSAPGVQGVAFSWGAAPLQGDDEWLFWIDGQPKPASESEMNWAIDYVVDYDYLRIMGIPLKSGRFFTAQDDEHVARVAVVDEVFAKQFFAGQSAIGKRLHLSGGETLEIVGVVGHVKQWGLDTDDKETLRAQLYTPFMQLPVEGIGGGAGVVVRSDQPAAVFQSIRQANNQMSSEQVVFGAQTMSEVIAGSIARRRFSMILFGIFAALALLLASIGIYGVVSYLAGQRTHEIGIRMALGAKRSDVLGMVLREGMKMIILGVAIGLLAAAVLTPLMASLLFGVSATDPLTFVGVGTILAMVALVACLVPARKAMRVDPMVALRYE
jgi:predicted permease